MNETKLSPRQSLIVQIINENGGMGRLELEKSVSGLYPLSKPTLIRELTYLAQAGLIRVTGQGRGTKYYPAVINPLLRFFDLDQYFALDLDRRVGARTGFNFDIFDYLNGLYSQQEITSIDHKNKNFSAQIARLEKDIYLKELERFVIELSWKSSKIEGNTYSLLETEALIKQSIEAAGRTRQEAVMILNHTRAFESILESRGEYKTLSLSHITQLHNFLIKDLDISAGIRDQAVGITGTVYPPDNKWQILEALEKLVELLNKPTYPLEKALVANTMISYIQPFADGNKRTGRMLANAILLAHDFYPLSYRSVDEVTYKKALVLFYEQNSLYHLKKIFTQQYQFAVVTYFQ